MIPRRSRSTSTDGSPPVQFVTVCAGALRIERAHGWNDVHRASSGPVSKEGAGGSPLPPAGCVRAVIARFRVSCSVAGGGVLAQRLTADFA